MYYTACFFRSVMNQSQPTSLCSLSMSTCCLLPNYCHFFNSVFREESFLEEKTNQDNESLISPHSHSIVFCSHGPLKLVSGRRFWNKIKVTSLLCWVLKVFICYLCVSKFTTIYHCPGKQLTIDTLLNKLYWKYSSCWDYSFSKFQNIYCEAILW